MSPGPSFFVFYQADARKGETSLVLAVVWYATFG